MCPSSMTALSNTIPMRDILYVSMRRQFVWLRFPWFYSVLYDECYKSALKQDTTVTLNFFFCN
jgi:hypothetical protein